jgi:monofunctional glycosyltransferase
MLRLHRTEGAFRRRADRSTGWVALESRQAAAIGRALRLPAREGGFDAPPEIAPFSPPPIPRRSFGEVTREIARAVLVWALALNLCYLVATAMLITVYRRVDPPVTVLMAYRSWRFGWKVQAPKPVKLSKVPRYLRRMLVAIEDYKFYEHHGIDLEAFARAHEINKRLGRPLYGGSTLTMQVARTLFLVPEKSYVRKYLEVLTAFELEALLPKERILELYFGYAEWGKGLFGLEAAARKWYGRGMEELSRDEAARLIALLSSPIKYGPDTIRKSRILSERYSFLSNRYDQPSLPSEAASSEAGAPSSQSGPANAAAATEARGAPPPLSPEPSASDTEENTDAAPAAPASGQ